MITIWKYPITIADDVQIEMPRGALPRFFSVEQGEPTLWAEVDTDQSLQPKQFKLIGTGHKLSDRAETGQRYIGTCHHGPFVWHLFEVVP